MKKEKTKNYEKRDERKKRLNKNQKIMKIKYTKNENKLQDMTNKPKKSKETN